MNSATTCGTSGAVTRAVVGSVVEVTAIGLPLGQPRVYRSHVYRTRGATPCGIAPLTCDDAGGRYWDRTSDLFRVEEARYPCANRPSVLRYVRCSRWRRDSNPCIRLCRPLPRLSATPP